MDAIKRIFGDLFGGIADAFGWASEQDWFWPAVGAILIALIGAGFWRMLRQHPIALVAVTALIFIGLMFIF